MTLKSWYVSIATIVLLFVASARSEEPKSIDSSRMDQAEVKLLRQSIERKDKQIADLQSQVTKLQEQLQSLGVAPQAITTTQPAVDRPSKRILFLQLDLWGRGEKEVNKAIDELKPDQLFNVMTPKGKEIISFSKVFLEASEMNKKRFHDWNAPSPVVYDDKFTPMLEAVAKVRPDVLWIVGQIGTKDEDKSIAEMKKAMAGTGTRINTTTAINSHTSIEVRHFLWRLSKETGGVCVDNEGNVIDAEPSAPFSIPLTPPPPKEKPSVLKN